MLEPKAVGSEFASDEWPLHVTIADTFAVDWIKADLSKQLEFFAKGKTSITATASHDETFGQNKDVDVTLLADNEDLSQLHHELIELLEKSGAVFNNPQYNKTGFRPHATVQPHARLNIDDEIVLDNLVVIDMFPDGDAYKRRVMQIITF